MICVLLKRKFVFLNDLILLKKRSYQPKRTERSSSKKFWVISIITKFLSIAWKDHRNIIKRNLSATKKKMEKSSIRPWAKTRYELVFSNQFLEDLKEWIHLCHLHFLWTKKKNHFKILPLFFTLTYIQIDLCLLHVWMCLQKATFDLKFCEVTLHYVISFLYMYQW